MKKLMNYLNRCKSFTLVLLKKLNNCIKEYTDDLLILTGLFFLVTTTFKVNEVAGLYTLGTVLFLLGIFFVITSKRG